jgi:hypothetical protein
MQNTGTMKRQDGPGQLKQRCNQTTRLAADGWEKMRAFHQFHREKPDPLIAKQFVQANEILVRDVGQLPELIFETPYGSCVPAIQPLQSGDNVLLVVVYLVNGSKTPGTENPPDLEPVCAVECRARLDTPKCRDCGCTDGPFHCGRSSRVVLEQ